MKMKKKVLGIRAIGCQNMENFILETRKRKYRLFLHPKRTKDFAQKTQNSRSVGHASVCGGGAKKNIVQFFCWEDFVIAGLEKGRGRGEAQMKN